MRSNSGLQRGDPIKISNGPTLEAASVFISPASQADANLLALRIYLNPSDLFQDKVPD
jgi:hypothetical protein